MSHDPQLVSAAVHALCDRDPLDMQACQRMVHFSPREHAMLMTGVKFTKCLYAQLLHQRFSSPRNNGFNLPPVGNQRYKACELGMKLVSEFPLDSTHNVNIFILYQKYVRGSENKRHTPLTQFLK